MTTTVADEPTETPQALKAPAEIFRHSAWVHVGEGAEECPDDGAGCTNPGHFHAWIRLPNRIQRDEIREKAMAAKARRVRLLKDPESDAAAVMRDAIDALADRDDKAAVIDEILGDDFMEDRQTARVEVMEEADGKFDHIDTDIERYGELMAQPETERNVDEAEELERHIATWTEAVTQKVAEIRVPRRARLEQLSIDELLNRVSKLRIQNESIAAFSAAHQTWTWLAGTWRSKPASAIDPGERKFDSESQIRKLPDEVIAGLSDGFLQLTMAFDGGVSGN
jgi:hypothetical protein